MVTNQYTRNPLNPLKTKKVICFLQISQMCAQKFKYFGLWYHHPGKWWAKLEFKWKMECLKSICLCLPNSKSKTYHSSIVQPETNTAGPLPLMIIKTVQISEVNMMTPRTWELRRRKGSDQGLGGARLRAGVFSHLLNSAIRSELLCPLVGDSGNILLNA